MLPRTPTALPMPAPMPRPRPMEPPPTAMRRRRLEQAATIAKADSRAGISSDRRDSVVIDGLLRKAGVHRWLRPGAPDRFPGATLVRGPPDRRPPPHRPAGADPGRRAVLRPRRERDIRGPRPRTWPGSRTRCVGAAGTCASWRRNGGVAPGSGWGTGARRSTARRDRRRSRSRACRPVWVARGHEARDELLRGPRARRCSTRSARSCSPMSSATTSTAHRSTRCSARSSPRPAAPHAVDRSCPSA